MARYYCEDNCKYYSLDDGCSMGYEVKFRTPADIMEANKSEWGWYTTKPCKVNVSKGTKEERLQKWIVLHNQEVSNANQ